MQFISTSRNLVNVWKSLTPRMRFSTVIIRHDPISPYEDWEYCQLITSQLKHNNCNQAISLLFQSYFNNQILDIQVYNQLFQKISQSSLALSYTEIVYLIYREHFPPHMLMLNWMNKLTYSKNQQLISRLRKDFQALGEKYPLRKSAKREFKQEQKIKQQSQIKFKPTRSEIQAFKNFIRLHRQQFHQAFDKNLQPEEIFRIKLSTQMKDILTRLNLKFSDHTELDFQGIQLQFFKYISQQDEEPPELPSDEQYQFDHPIHKINMKDYFGVDLNKIKIKKIEINHKKYKW